MVKVGAPVLPPCLLETTSSVPLFQSSEAHCHAATGAVNVQRAASICTYITSSSVSVMWINLYEPHDVTMNVTGKRNIYQMAQCAVGFT